MKVFERHPDVSDECSIMAAGPCGDPVEYGDEKFGDLVRFRGPNVRFNSRDSRLMTKVSELNNTRITSKVVYFLFIRLFA